MNKINDKKIIRQKNITKKIHFDEILKNVSDEELYNFYSGFSVEKLESKIKNSKNLPDQDNLVIQKILKEKNTKKF
ncbi:MAG: hypothetical protein ACRCW6_03305 [Mycoplasmoidaceae bacterium]